MCRPGQTFILAAQAVEEMSVSDPVEHDKDEASGTSEAQRQPWQPLGFEKISATEAESGTIGSGTDNLIYS